VTWLELTLIVESELADDIAAALIPHADGGVSISTSQIQDAPGPGNPIGPMTIKAYISVDEDMETRRAHIERALHFLGRIRAFPEPSFHIIADENWQGKWKQNYHPINVGANMAIVPAWEQPPETDRISILIDPGMAFGTGAHPTTRLCLLALEQSISGGEQVADLGAGSGILSVAARKLGAAKIHAWDIDPITIPVARENAELNKVDTIEFETGGLEECISSPDAPFDLVVANIFAHVITSMLENGLADSVSPGGRLILSGILEEQLPPILALASKNGLTLLEILRESDWTASILEKEKGAAPL